MTLGKHNVRAARPKDKLELKFFFELWVVVEEGNNFILTKKIN